MGLVSITTPNDGESIDASDVSNPLNTIVTAINGNIDSNNLASNAVTTAKITTNAVTADKLATSAITIGYAEITSNFTTTTTGSDVDVTGLSVTVTVPAGGRKVQVTAFCTSLLKSGAAGDALIWKLKESTTQLNESAANIPGSNFGIPGVTCVWESTPGAGSHTYKVAVSQTTAGTVTVTGAAGKLSFISVKVI